MAGPSWLGSEPHPAKMSRADFGIGGDYALAHIVHGRHFKGVIDEVRVYDVFMTAQEVAAASLIPEPATLVLIGLGALALRRRK